MIYLVENISFDAIFGKIVFACCLLQCVFACHLLLSVGKSLYLSNFLVWTNFRAYIVFAFDTKNQPFAAKKSISLIDRVLKGLGDAVLNKRVAGGLYLSGLASGLLISAARGKVVTDHSFYGS